MFLWLYKVGLGVGGDPLQGFGRTTLDDGVPAMRPTLGAQGLPQTLNPNGDILGLFIGVAVY